MEYKGAFIISRDIFKNQIWQDVVKFRIFFYILGKAVFSEDGITKGSVVVERGQWLISYRSLRDELEYIENNAVKKYSLSTIKRKVDELVAEERLKKEETKLGTLFTVVNYKYYQCFESYKGGGLEQQKNSKRTAKEQQENNNNNVKNVKNVKKYKYNVQQMQLAELLLKKIRENYPDYKKPNLENWANTIRLMMEQDKRKGKDIQDVILWCQKDNFWYKNVLSADKLRKQYDRLKIQMQDTQSKIRVIEGGKSSGTNKPDFRSDITKYDFSKGSDL